MVCVLLSHGVCKRLSRAELRERPSPPTGCPADNGNAPDKSWGGEERGATPLRASCSIGPSRRAQSDLRQRAANAALRAVSPSCAARCSRPRRTCDAPCAAGPRAACGGGWRSGGAGDVPASSWALPGDGTAEVRRFHFIHLQNAENADIHKHQSTVQSTPLSLLPSTQSPASSPRVLHSSKAALSVQTWLQRNLGHTPCARQLCRRRTWSTGCYPSPTLCTWNKALGMH